MEYKAVVILAFGTGGYFHRPHQYWTGQGVAISRSPKAAIAQAMRQANVTAGEGAEWIPIYQEVKLYKSGRLIYQDL